MVDFNEYDWKTHGLYVALMKHAFQKSRYSGVQEWMKEFGTTADGGSYSLYHKCFMMVNRVASLQELLKGMEKMLVKPLYTHAYAINADMKPPTCTAGRTLRVPENEILEPAAEPLNALPDELLFKMNNAPMLAFNNLFGEPIFRNKFEALWMKARSSKLNPAFGITDFAVDGGLRDKAFSNGDRIPYAGADMRVHPLCVAPVIEISLNKLILMCNGPKMFNLQVAATVKCDNAIIRFDTVDFMDEDYTHLKPRITSHLVNVRRHRNRAAGDGMGKLEYLAAIDGGAFHSMFVPLYWAELKKVLLNAHYA